jgi:ABC-type spermidine/putrescine transport system permease subunit I
VHFYNAVVPKGYLVKEGSSSFLKKTTKKLLIAWRRCRCKVVCRMTTLSAEAQVYLLAGVWGLLAMMPLLVSPVFSMVGAHGLRIDWHVSFEAFQDIIATGRWLVILRTCGMASLVTAICLASGFPFALWLALKARNPALLTLVWSLLTIPFFLDPAARMLVWRSVLGSSGMINAALLHLHAIHAPLQWLLFSDFAVAFGLVGSYFPNMVMPIYLAISLIDKSLLQASADLGAPPAATLRHVIVPLAMPGIVVGTIFSFVPIMGDGIVSNILGGGNQAYLADSIMALSNAMNYSGVAAATMCLLGLSGFLLALLYIALRRALPSYGHRFGQ